MRGQWKFGIPIEAIGVDPLRTGTPVPPSGIFDLWGGTPAWLKLVLKDKFLPRSAILRLNSYWCAIMAPVVLIFPKCFPHFVVRTWRDREFIFGIRHLYRWFITTAFNCGERFLLKRLKNMFDWCRYYSCFPLNQPPPLLEGLIGGTRDGWLTFPWARGWLTDVKPTVGPYKVEPKSDKHRLWMAWSLFHLGLGRKALGTASRQDMIDACKKHAENLSVMSDTPKPILAKAKEWARAYALDKLSKVRGGEKPPNITVNSSSVIESTRQEGGRQSYLVNLLKSYQLDETYKSIRSDGIPLYDIWGEQCLFPIFQGPKRRVVWPFRAYTVCEYELLFSGSGKMVTPSETGKIAELACWNELFKDYPEYAPPWYRPPDKGLFYKEKFQAGVRDPVEPYANYTVRGFPVPDRGAKARLITISPGAISTLLHLQREYFFQVLSNDREIGSLSGGESKYFLLPYGVDKIDRRGMVILSLDLSKATDTFYLDLLRELSQGLISASKFPQKLSWIEPFALANVHVGYPDFVHVDSIESKRAVLMGNANSWSLLNLYLRYLYELAWFLVKSATYVKTWHGRSLTVRFSEYHLVPGQWDKLTKLLTDFKYSGRDDMATQRCGDDQISVTKERVASVFVTLLQSCGAEPSPGTNIISKDFGVYTELLCTLVGEDRRLFFLELIKPVSMVRQRVQVRLPDFKETPIEWVLGVSCYMATMYYEKESDREKERTIRLHEGQYLKDLIRSAKAFSLFCCHDVIQLYKSLDIPVYLLREAGGAQFPHAKGRAWGSTTTSWKRVVRILLMKNMSPASYFSMKNLSSCWNVRTFSEIGSYLSRFNQFVEGLMVPMNRLPLDILTMDEFEARFVLKNPALWSNRDSLATFLGFSKEIPYLNLIQDKAFHNFAKEQGWERLDEALERATQILMKAKSFTLHGPDATKLPSLEGVSKALHKEKHRILKSTHYQFKEHWICSTSMNDIRERFAWAKSTLWVKSSFCEFSMRRFFTSNPFDPDLGSPSAWEVKEI